MGLPLSRVSRSARGSASASIRAATPRKTRAFSAPAAHRQGPESNDVRAAATAASTSVSVPPAYVPTTVSWPGLRLSNVTVPVAVLAADDHRPVWGLDV